jgi:hypothetical protein
MITKNGVLEISDQHLSYKDSFKESFINKINGKKRMDRIDVKAQCLDDIKVSLKNKNLFLIIHGEEVFVKYMILPKVKEEKLYVLIKEELSYIFKKIDNIMFTYDIFKDNGAYLDIVVFCLNWNKSDIIKKCINKGAEISGVCPVQFHILNNYRKKIKEKNYILIFSLQDSLYFLGCKEDKIIGNSVCKIFQKKNFFEELEKFHVKCCSIQKDVQFTSMFFLDFPYKDLIENLATEYKCTDLGEINKNI